MKDLGKADAIAYRLARCLDDLAGIAEDAMNQANRDGAEYDVEGELEDALLALKQYANYLAENDS